jgi:hypothetical protein
MPLREGLQAGEQLRPPEKFEACKEAGPKGRCSGLHETLARHRQIPHLLRRPQRQELRQQG